MSTFDLFDGRVDRPPEPIADGAWLLPGFALANASEMLQSISQIALQAPFRHQVTPGGYRMSASMTSCGQLGWVTDRTGYRYSPTDPLTGRPWPDMPGIFDQLARQAADAAGYPHFVPQGCLINRYETGARMSLHQDKDEDRLEAPIVSVSLGAPITFLFGGPNRTDPTARFRLEHGDVVVWGGASRMFFHGVAPLGKRAAHPATGAVRYNLTFRRVR
ncbi:DNA-N1-methyladenine dioxygenase [Halopseudomonas xinjiangensis]|uniref:DNA-N1-methyladenine dioxygenase n=1 Tax=Halopseudomonas xinjiangensis TaxID=487184 RepID=A0A1H1NFH0_9GAMM|nr:DNA oxidative demethylase AlkB [Halopseudomonas xinjiangensis]SDR97714.1 DNA-N1-methyladenine dioxygenase [Halopseudomonas xinjiangensis]